MILLFGLSYTVIGRLGGISGMQFRLISGKPAKKEEFPLVFVVSFRFTGGFLHLFAGTLVVIVLFAVLLARLFVDHFLFALVFPLLLGFLAFEFAAGGFLFGSRTARISRTSALAACGLGRGEKRQ